MNFKLLFLYLLAQFVLSYMVFIALFYNIKTHMIKKKSNKYKNIRVKGLRDLNNLNLIYELSLSNNQPRQHLKGRQ